PFISLSKSAIPRRILGLEPRKGGDSNGAGHSPWRYLLPPCRFLAKMVPYSKLSVYLCEGMCGPEADSSVRTAETRGFQRCRALPVAIPPSTLPLSGKDAALFRSLRVSPRGKVRSRSGF